MNVALSAIAAREENPRFMPPPPSVFHDHGGGKCEEVPLVNRDYLLGCGTEALYIVCQELDAPQRFAAESKEDLADIILSATKGSQPSPQFLPPPIIPPPPPTARQKRHERAVRRELRLALK